MATTAEIQTIDEMREAYKGEWAIVVDCEHNEAGWVLRGRVAVHSPDRDVVYDAMADYPGGGAIEYFGDEDPILML